MTKKIKTDTRSHDVVTTEDRQTPTNVIALPIPSKSLAKATHHVTERAYTQSLHPLQDNELRSIYTLFTWVANEQKAAKETVQCMTEARFGIDDVTKLKKRDYDEVIKFLIDLRIDEMKN